ncbi:hypothetical protein FHY33_001331 [Xanthomonas arboricola]|nr:hypothetical protein [Xanthomonas campestris]
MGRQTFKRTLHTYDMREIRLRAARHAQVFTVLRERRMQSRDDDLDALLARLTGIERPQELTLNRTRSANGLITEHWQIDSPEDVTLYQQLMALTAPQPSALGELIHQPLGIGRTHSAELAAPQVIGGLAETVPPAQVLDRHAGLSLTQEADDLFFAETLPHVQSPDHSGLESKPWRYSKFEGRRFDSRMNLQQIKKASSQAIAG